ncbi:MAG: lipocalin family protein [Mariniblastus sp.]
MLRDLSASFRFQITASLFASAMFFPLLSGCDLGTYGSRLAETPKNAPPAESKKTEQGETAAAPVKKAEPKPVGSWALDASASKVGDGDVADWNISFELSADGTYVSEVDTPEELADNNGTWTISGNKLLISQTHQDQESKKDSMSGTIDGNTITLTHGSNKYVLNRN